jgi:hypothetical protein
MEGSMPTRKMSASTLPRRCAVLIAAAVTATALLVWLLNRIPYNVVYDGEKVFIAHVKTMTATDASATAAVVQPPATSDAPPDASGTPAPPAVDQAWILSRCRMDLCVKEPGQDPRQLGIYPGLKAVWAPSWSSDGRQFIFEACPSDDNHDELCAWNAYRANRDGSGVEMLISSARYPTWSPDGQWIAFHRSAVMAVRSDLSEWRVVADLGSDEVHFLTWSPDSRQLAWIGGRQPEGGWSTVYVANLDGSGLHAIYEDPVQGRRPVWQEMAWSPDERSVIFQLENGTILQVDAGCNARELSCQQSTDHLAVFPEDWTARYWPAWGAKVGHETEPAGALLFEDDFEDGSADGITEFNDAGRWRVVSDSSGNSVYEVDNRGGTGYPAVAFGSRGWADYAVELRVRYPVHNPDRWGLILEFRASYSHDDVYILHLDSADRGALSLFYTEDNIPWTALGTGASRIAPETWYNLRLETVGERIRAFIDGRQLIDVTHLRFSRGSVGLAVGPGGYMQIDDIQVIALGPDGSTTP